MSEREKEEAAQESQETADRENHDISSEATGEGSAEPETVTANTDSEADGDRDGITRRRTTTRRVRRTNEHETIDETIVDEWPDAYSVGHPSPVG